jgi:hypothetical protein
MKLKLFTILFFALNIFAMEKSSYILTHDGLLDKRAQIKISEIGLEAKEKLGVNLYIDIKENNGIKTSLKRDKRIELMRKKEFEMTKDLKKPFVVLAISIDQLYANILISDNLKNIVDKDDILDGYVIPLLASKDKNSLFAKTSAASLNGFAQIADSIAESKNIKLKSSIGNEGKVASSIWKVFMYSLVVTGIVLYIIIIMREKKYKNLGNKNG